MSCIDLESRAKIDFRPLVKNNLIGYNGDI